MPVYSAISVRASTGLGSVPKQRSSERDFSPRTQHTTNVDIWCVCLSACLYAVCWEAHVPVLPYIAEKVGANSTGQFALMQSLSAVVTLGGGLAAGPLKDRYGAKALLLLSCIGSISGYVLMGSARTVTALQPNLIEHGWMAAQALIVDLSPTKERAILLGRLTFSYSIGSAIGPALGGLIVSTSITILCYSAALGAIVSMIMVALFVPDPRAHNQMHEDELNGKPRNGPTYNNNSGMISSIWTVASQKEVSIVLCTKAIAAMGSGITCLMLPIIIAEKFSPSPVATGTYLLSAAFARMTLSTGLIFSYKGVVGGVIQGCLISPFTRWFHATQIITLSVVGLAGTFLLFSFTSELWELLIVLTLLEVFMALFQTVTTATLTHCVSDTYTGTVIALDNSVIAALDIVSPCISSFLLTAGGHPFAAAMSSFVFAGLMILSPWQALLPT